ncbi:DUF3526 domain-containing protein [Pseudoteredinibacter isoporae]|uniref:ABC-2 type transport system permease protein n=1 Tax=Pseudoteredinibacter isoporae TaxID=570281 RepID=A0A7X0JVN3_9GAMM|nr:DUF3526 domain-containing protein [Pseudoteredinibacter isoporae]MBB6523027.1 ABC-2 type transport system permease protein [Pseudoteredinibacter isoporae]NHO88549.1 DUF3526 domain-containing protein [Pseudoteredinibacter isoporae]NIB22760.1 DUF3526 domain-containing protein [Pseudoteredinibacter isoporae]
MISFSDIKREARFLVRQRHIAFLMILSFALSVFAVWSGIAETRAQSATIERLLEKNDVDRQGVLAKQKNYGGAAYYSFHLTYAQPSSLAFAAMGQRDVFPWKHRIRMLALEGQIYETDADNPELSLQGRFDFAFLAVVLLPLFIILLLHDLRSGERAAGRYDLLVVTAANERKLWLSRAIVLCSSLAVAVLVPFLIGAAISGASLQGILFFTLLVLAHIAFWMLLSLYIGKLKSLSALSSAQLASVLLAFWLSFAVLIPVGSDTIIDEVVESPSGGQIVLTQREAVNDAWDLPFSATWDEFLKTHPEWADKTNMNSQFEWKWYYAFQQAGDQKAANLSTAYREATQKKDALAGWVALLSPPMLTQRLMTSIAETDIQAMTAYEQCIRDYHASLREYYYPLLFNDVEFSVDQLKWVPEYSSAICDNT